MMDGKILMNIDNSARLVVVRSNACIDRNTVIKWCKNQTRSAKRDFLNIIFDYFVSSSYILNKNREKNINRPSCLI